MNQYGVAVATYTFDQDNPNSRSTWRWKKSGGYSAKDIPIRLNPLFVPQAVRGGSEREIEANPYFYDSVQTHHFRGAGQKGRQVPVNLASIWPHRCAGQRVGNEL